MSCEWTQVCKALDLQLFEGHKAEEQVLVRKRFAFAGMAATARLP